MNEFCNHCGSNGRVAEIANNDFPRFNGVVVYYEN